MIEQIDKLLDKNLTSNHRDIVDSFRKNLLKYGSLTGRQVDYFHKIASNYTDEALQREADFYRKLKEDQDFRERLRVVAEYYQRTGYYRSVAYTTLQHLSNPSGWQAPDSRQVIKMMDNKYAKNVVASYFGEQKFAVGDLVQLRATVGKDTIRGEHSTIRKLFTNGDWKKASFIVVEVNSSPITRSLSYDEKKGGTRWYSLLPLGDTSTIEVIERDLKRPTAKTLRGE